jgi:DNA polymerase III subunit epsilon
MDFIAIDFETANRYRTSACAIGLTYVRNMEIVDQEYHLIRPVPFHFDRINQQVHGISADQVVSAPTFDELWAGIAPKINNRQLVAHNASFDFSVLRKVLEAYDLPFPNIQYCCSLQLFKKLNLPLPNNRLSSLAHYYNLKLQHHHALSDAQVCAQITLELMKDFGCSSIDELAMQFGYRLGEISGAYTESFSRTLTEKQPLEQVQRKFQARTHTYTANRLKFQNHTYEGLRGKRIVISGVFSKVDREDLRLMIINNGGKVLTGVSGKTDCIVCGDNMGPSKRAKAIALGIPLISEDEFLVMIKAEKP